MTFEEMVKIEPELGKLKDQAIKKMANSPGTWSKRTKYWYHELKPRFRCLVGFGAEKAKLKICEAYDLAYEELCTILKVW